MSAAGRAREMLGGLRLGHRVRALRGAASAVADPRRLVAGELALVPLRPVAAGTARLRGTTPGETWAGLTRHLGGQITTHTLRSSGRPVQLRRGTPDVFTLYETHGAGGYAPPAPAAASLDALGRPPRVLDLGANIGLFALYALGRWPGAEITSFEPDPSNLEVLRRNAQANRDASWRVVEAGAATASGTMPFIVGQFAVSRTPAAGERAVVGEHAVTTVPTVDALPQLASCDLLKMDIEGGEWPILADPRFGDLGAAAVVMEYHAWGCPGPDPEAAARAALVGAGFTVGPPLQEEPGSGTLWAWRTRSA